MGIHGRLFTRKEHGRHATTHVLVEYGGTTVPTVTKHELNIAKIIPRPLLCAFFVMVCQDPHSRGHCTSSVAGGNVDSVLAGLAVFSHCVRTALARVCLAAVARVQRRCAHLTDSIHCFWASSVRDNTSSRPAANSRRSCVSRLAGS